MSTTITFVERATTGAITSGADVTLRVFDRGLGKENAARLAAIREALAPQEVLLENLEHGSWAWMFVVPGMMAVIATAVFGSILAAGAGVAVVLLLTQLRTPEVTATLRVRCRSLAALDRCLDVCGSKKGVTVTGVVPTSDEPRRDGEIYERARKRADAMSARAGLRVTELVAWEEVAPPPFHRPEVSMEMVSRKRASMGEGLLELTLAPDPAAVRFVFLAETIS